MLTAAWLMLSTLLYSLQLNTGSFPKPLSAEEERYYLTLAQAGDLDAGLAKFRVLHKFRPFQALPYAVTLHEDE